MNFFRKTIIVLGVVIALISIFSFKIHAADAPGTTVFTATELAKYNGKNGQKVYFAYKGVVYDATGSQFWKEGEHYGLHAGIDLTGMMTGAPHGEEVLAKLPVVGSYADVAVVKPVPSPVTAVEVPRKTQAWYEGPIRIAGISLLGWTGILLGVFFVLTFATCFATPWSSLPLPWKGSRPGTDELDAAPKHMPWSHLHKYVVWFTIILGIIHGVLGLLQMVGLRL